MDRRGVFRPLDRLHDLNSAERLADYDYALPPELIAQQPLSSRSASRLLQLGRSSGGPIDRQMRELPQLLEAGDLLVFNDTRVVPARLFGHKASGGRVEIFLERVLAEAPDRALAQLRASKALHAGQQILTPGGEVTLVNGNEGMWEIRTPGDALDFFERYGHVPLPPYITRGADAEDRERYQSLLARAPGAVAAPTASLHFDAELLQALDAGGVQCATVTLHVGAGTFQPVRVDDLDQHRMHPERYTIPADLASRIAATRTAGRRVVAVGTTVVRALETSAAAASAAGSTELLQAGAGESRLFIRPGFRFRVVDALLTNFHLPRSTLLMLVAAFAGRERMLAAYRHAVRERYRFFSYGDAMLIAD